LEKVCFSRQRRSIRQDFPLGLHAQPESPVPEHRTYPTDRLSVIPIQHVGQLEDSGEVYDPPPLLGVQRGVGRVPGLGRAPPVITRHIGHQENLPRGKAGQNGSGNENETVLVVPAETDGDPDVMQDACGLQQASIGLVQAVQGLQLIEERRGQSGHLAAMGLVEPIRTPEGEEGPFRFVCVRDANVRERDGAARSGGLNIRGMDAGHSKLPGALG
jgi:hypothetical protein